MPAPRTPTMVSATPPRSRPPGASILIGLILLAAAVRFGTLGAKGFWGDELSTVDLVHRSLSHMLTGIGNLESTPPALLPGLVALGEGVPQHRGGNPRSASDLRCPSCPSPTGSGASSRARVPPRSLPG